MPTTELKEIRIKLEKLIGKVDTIMDAIIGDPMSNIPGILPRLNDVEKRVGDVEKFLKGKEKYQEAGEKFRRNKNLAKGAVGGGVISAALAIAAAKQGLGAKIAGFLGYLIKAFFS